MTWPDLRAEGEPRWAYQWCHGAPGIGLARLAMLKHGLSAASPLDAAAIATDVENAVGGVEHDWPGHLDTLCCGTFGGIELLREASVVLRRDDFVISPVDSSKQLSQWLIQVETTAGRQEVAAPTSDCFVGLRGSATHFCGRSMIRCPIC